VSVKPGEVQGIYSLAIYVVMARANINIPASVVLDAFTSDIIGAIVISTVVVAWYIYLIRSRRVRETYNTSSTASSSQSDPLEKKDNKGIISRHC